MKTGRPIIFILTFFACCQFAFGQTKRALIFDIGNYPEESGWPVIASGHDDSLIRKALTDQKFSDIKVVRDKEATIKGIKNALNELIERSNPDDIVVIHVS